MNEVESFKEAYLFGKWVCGGKVSVPLAVDCRLCTSTNCIHFPVSVVIVHHMKVTMTTPTSF